MIPIGVAVLVLALAALTLGLQWLGVIKGWQAARRLAARSERPPASWRARLVVTALAGLGAIAGALLIALAHSGH